MTELGKEWSGHSIDKNTGKQGLQYGGLVVPLINAVKELSSNHDTLKAEHDTLKIEHDALKQQYADLASRLSALENN